MRRVIVTITLSALMASAALRSTTSGTASSYGSSSGSPDNFIFTSEEMKNCTRVRTPSLVNTGHSLHLFVRCCGPNKCSSKHQHEDKSLSPELGNTPRRLGDDDIDTKVATKVSYDQGKTWSGFTIVSGPNPANTNAAGIYDRVNRKIVVMYQYIPGGSTKPIKATTYYTIESFNDGATWTTPNDITDQLSGCQYEAGNMMAISAGNKIQDSLTGDYLFPMHDHSGHISVAISRNYGKNWTCSDIKQGNEVSIAQTKKHGLLMNGRGQQFWTGTRANYYSTNHGQNWNGPYEVKDLIGVGCERSLVFCDGISACNGTLFSSGPTTKHRSDMQISCSHDDGNHWKHSTSIYPGYHGGYSDLALYEDSITMVSEENEGDNEGNMWVTSHGYNWC